MKALLIIAALLLFAVLCFGIYYMISYFVEMVYAKACLIQTIDEIIKMFRYEQIILAKLGIAYKTSICRGNFNNLLMPVYNGIRRAYEDIPNRHKNMPDDYYESLMQSYTDNINSINILLMDYEIYNVRYSVARDKLLVFSKLFVDYPFLDTDLKFRLDNGIAGTGAIGH